jgi:hypothetical protein
LKLFAASHKLTCDRKPDKWGIRAKSNTSFLKQAVNIKHLLELSIKLSLKDLLIKAECEYHLNQDINALKYASLTEDYGWNLHVAPPYHFQSHLI